MFRRPYVFVSRKFRQLFKDYYKKKDIALLGDKNFVIVSNNCWGGSLYQWYNRPYNTPFVGLFICGDCFVKLLSNFEHYMSQDLQFIKETKYPLKNVTYPIGLLDDIEIHFQHYLSEDEAKIKWKRRTERMLEETNFDNYFFKISDKEQVTKNNIVEFHKLPFRNKISFSLNRCEEIPDAYHIKVEESHKNNKFCVPNGKKLFKITYLYLNLNSWLTR
ncbi:DUF1919 domain-containing protein [Mariniflexile sp. AS56]|uniref:DUF1919 domain-containing protein n=1 Tax=Mariniflexile sp. AS56 TaxID=3063957 RepID=UPI0026EB0311|nr:DUF1919 domain-containing protein [Mariniflexile sp. AS56]MDO7171509.1 DUF1919 domain-containing protein [Mariniflexile sp. AS56]